MFPLLGPGYSLQEVCSLAVSIQHSFDVLDSIDRVIQLMLLQACLNRLVIVLVQARADLIGSEHNIQVRGLGVKTLILVLEVVPDLGGYDLLRLLSAEPGRFVKAISFVAVSQVLLLDDTRLFIREKIATLLVDTLALR